MAEQLKTEALETQDIVKRSEKNKNNVDYNKQKDIRKNIEGQEKISLTVETTKEKINTIVSETKTDVKEILPKKVGKTKAILLASTLGLASLQTPAFALEKSKPFDIGIVQNGPMTAINAKMFDHIYVQGGTNFKDTHGGAGVLNIGNDKYGFDLGVGYNQKNNFGNQTSIGAAVYGSVGPVYGAISDVYNKNNPTNSIYADTASNHVTGEVGLNITDNLNISVNGGQKTYIIPGEVKSALTAGGNITYKATNDLTFRAGYETSKHPYTNERMDRIVVGANYAFGGGSSRSSSSEPISAKENVTRRLTNELNTYDTGLIKAKGNDQNNNNNENLPAVSVNVTTSGPVTAGANTENITASNAPNNPVIVSLSVNSPYRLSRNSLTFNATNTGTTDTQNYDILYEDGRIKETKTVSVTWE